MEKLLAKIFRFTTIATSVLTPLLIIVYTDQFIDATLIYKHYLFHEIVIALVIIWSAAISYVAYQCYQVRHETFLRYMTLAFIAQTIVYSMHGILTRTDAVMPILFILYGPVSRLIMAFFLAAALLKYASDTIDQVDQRYWKRWIIIFTGLIPLIALLAFSPVGTSYYLRAGMEALSILIYLFVLGVFLYRRINTPLMWLYALALNLFAQSSLAFIFVEKPWNHMFWLGHILFAAGFFVVSYGLNQARKRSSTFSEIFNEDLLYSQLSEQVRKLEQEIDAHKQTEQKLELAKIEADRASTAKSEFLASISHELRTPLNAILGFSQLLSLEKNTFNNEQQDSIRRIHSSGEHLLALINELLDLASIEAGKTNMDVQHVSTQEILRESLAMVMPLAEQKGIQIQIATTNDYIVLADYTRLKQALLNYLSNAVKYNNINGEIHLHIETTPNKHIRINVTDTGSGIKSEDMHRLFSSFERLGVTSSVAGGTGIGLAITRKLVELMHGKVGASSQPGIGSTFWIELPIAP